jgi:hypothetical protein
MIGFELGSGLLQMAAIKCYIPGISGQYFSQRKVSHDNQCLIKQQKLMTQ